MSAILAAPRVGLRSYLRGVVLLSITETAMRKERLHFTVTKRAPVSNRFQEECVHFCVALCANVLLLKVLIV